MPITRCTIPTMTASVAESAMNSVLVSGRELGDADGGQDRDRRQRAHAELGNSPQRRVHEEGHDRRVEPDDRGEMRDLGVRHGLRDEHRGAGEGGDDVPGEIGPFVVRQPVEHGDPAAHREIMARRIDSTAVLARRQLAPRRLSREPARRAPQRSPRDERQTVSTILHRFSTPACGELAERALRAGALHMVAGGAKNEGVSWCSR
jgi:hypothetical protein